MERKSLDWKAWYLTAGKDLKEQGPSSPLQHTQRSHVGTMLGRAGGAERLVLMLEETKIGNVSLSQGTCPSHSLVQT